MCEHRAVPLLVLGLGLASVAGLGIVLGVGPPRGLMALALAGAVLVLVAQQRMARLPGENGDES